jgi:DNA primase catalytic subunit
MALVEHGRDREVAVRYNEKFGSRPDILQFEHDVLESAKKGATSFHCSEERWHNPLQLSPSMKLRDLAELRMGWDLVIDVDCKNWEYSKLITHILVHLLRSFGITVSVKFSGNKGFHIGVPFEAFPARIHGKEVRLLFPDGPRRIALYLINLLEKKFFELVPDKSTQDIAHALGLSPEEITIRVCVFCDHKQKVSEEKMEFICPSCDDHFVTTEQLRSARCVNCGKREFENRLDTDRILEIDTLLISSRHLYRAPYSLHEKSGLVSLPINPELILEFEKEQAEPDNITFDYVFLPRTGQNETSHLFMQAFDFSIPQQRKERIMKEIEIPGTAIPEDHFPQCIKKLASGLEDGKKRAVFILINFLRSSGWSNEQVEKYLREWNGRNAEPLRENYLIGQMRHAFRRTPILPPNCSNISYYQSLGCKCAENICNRVRNPVNYAKRAMRYGKKKKSKNDRETVPPSASNNSN